ALEDLHWSDPTSLDLLRAIARDVREQRMLLVVTYRAGEDERLRPVMPLLVRESTPERIDLRPLEAPDIESLVAARYALNARETRRLVAYLQSHAEGNPFFVGETLHTLEAERLLRPEGSVWTLGDLEQAPVPALVRQIVESRLETLSEGTRQALSLAAIVGHAAPFDVLRAISGLDEDALLDAVELAIAARLVVATPDGLGLRFVHALVRETVYEAILPPRRRARHREIAEALLAAGDPDPDALAHHLQQAGDPRAIEWLVLAGERAYRAYAWRTAIERFDAAAQLMADDPDRARDCGWLLYRTGRMLRMSNPADGVERLVEAERVARSIGDDVLAAYALADRGLARCFAGDIRRGIDEMAAGVAALDELPPDHLSRDPSIATWVADALRTDDPIVGGDTNTAGSPAPHNIRRSALALWLAVVGRHAEAIAIGEACKQEVADATQLTELAAGSLGDACGALGLSYGEMGRRDEADAAYEQARETYRGFDHHELVSGTATNHLWVVACPYFATDLARLRWLVAEAEAARSRSQGALGGTVSPASSGALALVFPTGEWVEARGVIDAALQQTNMALRPFAVCGAAYVAWGQGDADIAWQHIQETLADGPNTQPGGQNFGPALDLQRLAVTLALDDGDLDQARAWLESQDRWLAWGGAVRRQADAQLLWARYRHASGDAEAAREHIVQALRLAGDPAQPLVLLAAHRFAAQLDTGAGQYADAEQHLQQALVLADACAAPFERALSLLASAELHVSIGEVDRVRAVLDEARGICLELEARPTLERIAALELEAAAVGPALRDIPDGLTSREVEVLQRVAVGQSNRQISDALFLSPRTVERHIANIYRKADLHNKAEATAYAMRHGLA
ncbi:MAG TPA: LuxR C-terminal-related transcriptional regulator, partial [Thermomicrobiales bacterium]|nr:LuxR C-terminal-related transcriptional regulator [Thermomicrobiales bacterium]